MDRSELLSLGRDFGYSPPRPYSRKTHVGVDVENVFATLSKALLDFFSRFEVYRTGVSEVPFVHKDLIPSDIGDLSLTTQLMKLVHFDGSLQLKMDLLNVNNEPISEVTWANVDDSNWLNVHRFTDLPYEGQGIATLLLRLSEIAVATQVQVTQKEHSLVVAPYQLDVLRFFLNRGFNLPDGTTLSTFLNKQSGVRLITDESNRRKPWVMKKGKVNHRITLTKPFLVA